MSLIANNMETKMNKYFLAEVCSYLLRSTLKNQDTKICLSKTAEYEGEYYIFLANTMRIGDRHYEPDLFVLNTLTYLPRFLCNLLAVCTIHHDIMTHEYIYKLILDKLEEIEELVG